MWEENKGCLFWMREGCEMKRNRGVLKSRMFMLDERWVCKAVDSRMSGLDERGVCD